MGWHNEAADLINRLLKRKSDTRLGKNGIAEIKSHLWFKSIEWERLYKKELESPYTISTIGDNFDKEFVQKEDIIDQNTYDVILKKINGEKQFSQFYFNFYDPKKEKYFEYRGSFYKFQNLHDEDELSKSHYKEEIRKTSTTSKGRKSNGLDQQSSFSINPLKKI